MFPATMSERILVLEDDTNLRAELQEVLEDEGYQVEAVGQGEEAVRRILGGPFDLLVADVRMEGIDGLEAVARMRSSEASVPVLVITGYASEADSIRAIRLGVGDYLRKPFRLEEFRTAVQSLLARTARERAQHRREGELRELVGWLGDVARPASSLALHLARVLGLDPHRRLLAQLAAATAHQEGMPLVLADLANHAQERWDGSGPRGLRGEEILLEGRIGALARERSQQSELPLARFLEEHRGRFDPFLPELLEASSEGTENVPRLLALASTLLELGDQDGARQALDEALAQGPQGQLRVDALLLLGRLDEAVEVAVSLGPAGLAQAQRQAGLRALESRPGSAQEWLRACHDQLREPSEQAQVRLAYQSLAAEPVLRPEDVRLLLAPQHELLRIQSLRWLLPLLWKAARPQAEALAAEYPRTAARVLPLAGVKAGLPTLTLRSFGVFQVLAGEQPVDERAWRGSRVKHLFAYLASCDPPAHEERVLDLFWSDGTEKGRRGLSSALSVLRRALPREGDYLQRRGDLLLVNPELVRWHDLTEWERCMRTPAAGEEAVESWRTAVKLYSGPYLDGCYMDWVLERRTRLETETLEAALRVAAADLAAGRYEAGLAMAEQALVLDDCSQSAQSLCLKLLLGWGRPEQAIRRFEAFQKTLARELGLEPSLELLDLYHRARLNS